jgi:acyl-coenzyme A thioesterase PaaI-like protein
MEITLDPTPENDILRWWRRFNLLPGGPTLFSLFLGWYAPYSGSIRARVESVEQGQVHVILRDRRGVRNHLHSIHAIALMNLGEITSGLAVLSSIPANMRGIVLGLSAEYFKKARGKLTARAKFKFPDEIGDNTQCKATAEIADEAGDIVAIIQATWLIGYRNPA